MADDEREALRPAVRPAARPTTWLGAISDSGAVVKAKVPWGTDCRLAVTKASGGETQYFSQDQPPVPSHVARFRVTGLEPLTEYRYKLEISQRPSTFPEGTLRTVAPAGHAWSFGFAFSSCAASGSQHEVFTSILERRPAVFLHLGDLHYSDISRPEPRYYRAAWDTVLSSTTQSALFRSIPFAYVWDDHDFGPNNSDLRAPGGKIACQVYREYAPVYALPTGAGEGAIYHAFTIGRVRFIMTDLRSQRSPHKTKDGPEKTMMGAEQKAWFKQELRAAALGNALVVWASSVPWIGNGGGDCWESYAAERRELSEFMAEIRIRNLCILCGDAHMLAADDGRNSDYSGTGSLKIPVLHGSALDQGGSYKGGPYSEGYHTPHAGEGCFGWVEVEDDGRKVVVNFTGRNQRDEIIVKHRFEV
jgi:phosphodiesterase/alkaline phosphatase D-like protein